MKNMTCFFTNTHSSAGVKPFWHGGPLSAWILQLLAMTLHDLQADPCWESMEKHHGFLMGKSTISMAMLKNI